MQAHNENNHCGRISLANILHKAKWYWYGMNQDIQNIIKTCAICNQLNKYKIFKKKLIIDKGLHFRYVPFIWYFCDKIKIETGNKYVLDIIAHFSKWYLEYLLNSKKPQRH